MGNIGEGIGIFILNFPRIIFSSTSEHLHEGLRREVPVDSLIRHLDNTDQRVLLSSLALINALYSLADREERISIVKVKCKIE